ncbi:MAG: response regulator [Halobacteriovoraceae bacterium]|nr:response regulator [Halobacteriovoraceae bacterium]
MAYPKNLKVLVIDDISSMRDIMVTMLKEIGFNNIEEAQDGHKAWEMIEDAQKEGEPYQFFVSDWNMPKMSGIDLLKKVRAKDELKEIPFLMITGRSEQRNVVSALKEKVTHFIIKPFSSKTLREKIDKIFTK